MKLNLTVLKTFLLAGNFLALSALAQTNSASTQLSDGSKESGGELTLGFGYLDDGSYKYGKYTGLTETGFEPLLDFRLQAGPEANSGETGYWRVEGERLGLESRRFELEAGQQGSQRLRLDYREIPRYLWDDAQTPVRGVGSTALTLPAGWQATEPSTAGLVTLEEYQRQVNLWQERRSLKLDYQNRLDEHWILGADFRRDRVEGVRSLGGATGSTGGNVRALLLPAPLDYETHSAALSLGYNSGAAYRWTLAYQGSFFHNGADSLTWPTPFGQHPQWPVGVGYPEGVNQLGLEPDNQAHQLRAQGSLVLTATSRLHLDAAFGRQTQDDAFLPYTINSNLTVEEPLPRESLDARVDTTRVNLRLTSRPMRSLNLVTRLRYRERDNKTPVDAYQRVRSDAGHQQEYIDARLNRPYSRTKSEASIDAKYRLSRGLRLESGYEYIETERDYSEVSRTDEHGIKLGLRSTKLDRLALALDYRHLRRRANEYVGNRPLIETHVPGSVDAEDFENHPLLRKYYLTDRDRDQWRLRADWFLSTRVSLGAALAYNRDDYDSGYLGLNESQLNSYTLDARYRSSEHLRVSGFVNLDRYRNDQSGRSFRGSVPEDADNPERTWHLDSQDEFDTLGLSFHWDAVQRHLPGILGQLDLSLELLHSRSRGELDMRVGSALETAPLPELSTRLNTLRLESSYALSERSSLRFGIEHERYRSADFAFDNVETDSVASVLLLGRTSPHYNATWTTLGYRLTF